MEISSPIKYGSLEWVRKIISEDFPNLRINNVEFISECFGNKVYLLNNKYLVRFAKDQLTSMASQVVAKYIKILREQHSISKIPSHLYERPISSKSQFFYSISEYFFGMEMSKDYFHTSNSKTRNAFLKEIGQFFSHLHSIDISTFQQLRHFNDWRHIYARQSLYQNIINQYFSGKEKEHFTAVLNWYCQFFLDDYSRKYLIHGDLTAQNIIVDAQSDQIVGFIDFDSLSLGRREIDLARVVQSFGIDILPALCEYAEIPLTLECRQLVEAFLVVECLNFFRSKMSKYAGSEEILRDAARKSLHSIYLGKYDISEFKTLVKKNNV